MNINIGKPTELAQKTNIYIKQSLGIALVIIFGAIVASFSFLPTIFQKESIINNNSSSSFTTNQNVFEETVEDLSKMTSLSEVEYANKLNEPLNLADDVSIRITSPIEGDILTGSGGDNNGYIKAELNDPNHKVSGIRFEIFNDDYRYWIFLGKVNKPPYQVRPNLTYYKSGVYRYIVKAVAASDASIIATDEIWVTLAHSCYHAMPTFSFSKTDTDSIEVAPGESFTLIGKVTNNHRGQCSDLFYFLQKDYSNNNVAPAGWKYEVTPAKTNSTKTLYWNDIPEGDSLDITVKVTLPTSTPDGQYIYPITARWDNSGFKMSDSVQVKVKTVTDTNQRPVIITE